MDRPGIPKLIEKHGVFPNMIVGTYNTTFTMLALCRAGLGVSICSKTFLWDDLQESPKPDRELYFFLPMTSWRPIKSQSVPKRAATAHGR